MGDGRPTVLALLGAFWPGNDATGPNTTFRAMIAALRDDFRFRVFARDRPWGGAPLVDTGTWHALDDTEARYFQVGPGGTRGLVKAIRHTPHDVMMLNGFFDREFTIPALLARRAGIVPRRPTIMSPRGEFSRGALDLKAGRKSGYLQLARRTGLLRGVIMHATSAAERDDLHSAFPGNEVRLASNIRLLPPLPVHVPRETGAPLRAAFVGRISPVKGLDLALRALRDVRTPLTFDIFGPISDAAYWRECQRIAADLPPDISIVHRGELPNEQVLAALAGVDVMLLPSRSENFGHAIFESLAAGTPVVIGPDTPWQGLASTGAGYGVALDPTAISAAIARLSIRTPEETLRDRAGARAFVQHFVEASGAIGDTRAMIAAAAHEGRSS